MRAVVIGNGDINNYEYIKSKLRTDDFIICADGGYNHAVKMNIIPDVLLGDFDSAEDFEKIEDRIEYPVRKDYTDGEIAVEYAVEHGYDNILMLGMTGNRFDHTLTDALLLTKCRNGVLIDDNNEIYLLRDSIEISGRKGQTLSIIPINGNVSGIYTNGLEYPLRNETLYFGAGRGVSNVMTDDMCSIVIKSGQALVVKVEQV
ncbi:MAG: thiamine diphosphokinase [Clostridia bacterium]|nr:thiamine diphosphokinase [Clostridia bacterium]